MFGSLNLPIKPNRRYRTRDGHTVVTYYSNDQHKTSDIITYAPPNGYERCVYVRSGQADSRYPSDVHHDHDLVEEWHSVTPIYIEVGKYYKTRDGRKAYVTGNIPDPTPNRPYHGYIIEKDGRNVHCSWFECGLMVKGGELAIDIVEVWREPMKGVRYMNVYKHGKGVSAGLNHTRAEADRNADGDTSRIACIKVEWVEGQFDE